MVKFSIKFVSLRKRYKLDTMISVRKMIYIFFRWMGESLCLFTKYTSGLNTLWLMSQCIC